MVERAAKLAQTAINGFSLRKGEIVELAEGYATIEIENVALKRDNKLLFGKVVEVSMMVGRKSELAAAAQVKAWLAEARAAVKEGSA